MGVINKTTMIIQNNSNAESDVDSAEERALSPKQLKRSEERKVREVKKLAKRQEKAVKKERKAVEKEQKEERRERKMEEIRFEKETSTPLELEESKRKMEEKALFEKEFEAERARIVNHTKKSSLQSNRLGGKHMA